MSEPAYTYETDPLDHQRADFEDHRDAVYWARFWEQGTGKTKPTIDEACYLFEHGHIDAVIVVASDGVHRNWVEEELPKHIPQRLRPAMRGLVMAYESKKAATKAHKNKLDAVTNGRTGGFPWLLFGYSGFMTKAGKKAAAKFLRSHRCLYILDEADRIKTPGAKRAISIQASGKYAVVRRALTGTPITKAPFDVYTQMKFLDPDFWKRTPYGLSDFADFKAFFGTWKEMPTGRRTSKGKMIMFPKCAGYRNLDILRELIQGHSSRYLKDEVLDLPPKFYTSRQFDMTSEQWKLYRELRDDGLTFWGPDEEYLTRTSEAMVKLLRFQQITCGYLPNELDEEGDSLVEIPGGNPRIRLMQELAEHTPHSGIIWARFTRDIELILEALGEDNCYRYDGKVSEDDRSRARKGFQNGDRQWFVGNAAAGSDGITLTRAKTCYYYNNSFKYRDRKQSEDRCHRYGQDGAPVDGHEGNHVLYTDIQASGTVDTKITKALRQTYQAASEVLGDDIKEWI
tara:strand:+ start:1585 stop:3120 length:1536 start_codon:yes stop_codon:yes gene_type:complete